MNYIVLSIPIFFILIGVEVVVGKLQKTEFYRFNDAVSNISCGIMQQIISALTKTVLIIGYIFLYDNYRLFDISDSWWTYILLFIGVDFFYYWFHRLSHEVNILWGAHIVHHQSEEYNLSVALRQSSLQGFFSTIFYLPLAVVGSNPIAFVTINAFQTLYQFWIHTKVIDRLPRVFEYVLNTPSHHRVHHGRNPKYIDKNHGGTLIIFDRMFGTFQVEEEEVIYGVTKPLQSWNPVWANLDYYKDMWAVLGQRMKWSERLRYVFSVPGWQPEEMGGYQPAPEITRASEVKYDTKVTAGQNYYILTQYVLVLLATSLLLFNLDHTLMTRSLMLGASAWIIWSIANMGGIFESRRWARFSEPARWVVLDLAVVYYISDASYIAAIIALSMISMLAFIRISRDSLAK